MSIRSIAFSTCLISLLGGFLPLGASRASADESLFGHWLDVLGGRVPHETALGLYAGRAYDWSDMSFFMVSWQALYDYEAIWVHRAPEGLGIRFEGNLGVATGTDFSGERLIASGDFLAVYEFGSPKTARVVPYIEGGVGVIYTDFQREGQGLRLNFNPVLGFGIRLGPKFIVLRAHHVSNADLDDDNRGINSIVLGVGSYF